MQQTTVFATTTKGGTVHLENDSNCKSRRFQYGGFKNKNIIKCAVGEYHSMFLENNWV